MNNEIFNKLFNLALDNQIGITVTKELSCDTPSFVDVNSRQIVINSNYKNKRQLPFQLAHEMAHVFNHDEESSLLYFSISKMGIELEANKLAIKLLVPFYVEDKRRDQLNYCDFMEEFCIPVHLENVVRESLLGFLF